MSDSNELPPRRSDGEETHRAILEAAMRLGSIEGLGAVTIGRLAAHLGGSKSGVYAHFRSKERLQRETIAAARTVFEREVLTPGLARPAGLEQLAGVCEAFLSYVERGVFPGGCFFGQLLGEFDAPNGPIHDEVVNDHLGWVGLLEGLGRTAQDLGELAPDADLRQLAFELHAALELANYLTVLHRDSAFVAHGRRAVHAALARSMPWASASE